MEGLMKSGKGGLDAGTIGSLASRTAFVGPLIWFSVVFFIALIITGIVAAIDRSVKTSRGKKQDPNYTYKTPTGIIVMWVITALIFVFGAIIVGLLAFFGNKYNKQVGDVVGQVAPLVI